MYRHPFYQIVASNLKVNCLQVAVMESKMKLYFIVSLFMKMNGVLLSDNCNLIPEVRFPNGKVAGKRLEGFTVLNTTADTSLKCFAKCSEHCLCKSVNLCGKVCQLNSGSKADAALSDTSDCTYYEVSWTQWNSAGVSILISCQLNHGSFMAHSVQNKGIYSVAPVQTSVFTSPVSHLTKMNRINTQNVTKRQTSSI